MPIPFANDARTRSVDVAIVGAGPAGLAAYRAAVAITDNVLVIGGVSCFPGIARAACMPSRLLIAAADAARGVRSSPDPGAPGPEDGHANGSCPMQRIRVERDRFVRFMTNSVAALPERHRLRGEARFVGAGMLQVGEEVLRPNSIVLANSSHAVRHRRFAGLGDRLLVSEDVFDLPRLPRSVAVFGPGMAGLELGQAFHRLGVRVRVFGEGGHVGPLTDPRIREDAERILGAELRLDANAHVRSLQRVDDYVSIRFVLDGEEVVECFDYVLSAAPRAPNVESLDLPLSGLALDAGGVPFFDRLTLRCGSSCVFIASEVHMEVPVLHRASAEGMLAGRNAASFPFVGAAPRLTPMSILFTDPQMAVVGARWDAVRSLEPVVGEVSFEDQGSGRVLLAGQGRLHLYLDRASTRLLGAEMVGPGAEHLAHLLAWAHQLELTAHEMLRLPVYHPLVGEVLRSALQNALRQLRHPDVAREVDGWAPGPRLVQAAVQGSDGRTFQGSIQC